MNQSSPSKLVVRPARTSDAPGLCTLLNEIIAIGGSTAYQQPLSAEDFANKFISGAGNVSCFVAESADGSLLGYQWLTRSDKLPENWGDIATFAKANSGVRGIGTALFKQTRLAAIEDRLEIINATIRGDNVSGLGYYSKMGFVDYNTIKDVPLSDGHLVDRIQKKYSVIDVA